MDVDALAPLVIASRTLVGLVFLTAATGKLRDPAAFYGSVHAYRLLPNSFVGPLARLVPWAELVVGLLLPTGAAPGPTAMAAGALLLVFVGAMAINMLRGRRDIDCGCFRGRPSQRLTWSTVGRTAALAVVAGVSGLPAAPSIPAAIQGLVAGAILFVVFATASALPTFERKRPRISL